MTYVKPEGYVMIHQPGHPRANSRGHIFEHVLIVEAAIGKPLRKTVDVHHIDNDPGNNKPANLVACDSHSYHMLIHMRSRALAACGDANARPCQYCKKHDNVNNLAIYGTHAMHSECTNAYRRARYVKSRRAA